MITNIGKIIKKERELRNLKQEDIASITGVTVSAISSYEKSIRTPSVPVLMKIASFLRISLDYMCFEYKPRTLDVSDLDDYEVEKIIEYIEDIKTERNMKNRQLNNK